MNQTLVHTVCTCDETELDVTRHLRCGDNNDRRASELAWIVACVHRAARALKQEVSEERLSSTARNVAEGRCTPTAMRSSSLRPAYCMSESLVRPELFGNPHPCNTTQASLPRSWNARRTIAAKHTLGRGYRAHVDAAWSHLLDELFAGATMLNRSLVPALFPPS